MIDEDRKKEAKDNFDRYLRNGLLKKETSRTAKEMYRKNADMSLKTAQKLMDDEELEPYLWVIVCSYYSMFYMANAVLIDLGYKTQHKIVHKVTNDALVVLVKDRLKKELLEGYEEVKDDAMELADAQAEEVIEGYEYERRKRSQFQYEMSKEAKKTKAQTSLERAKKFVYELRKLLRG